MTPLVLLSGWGVDAGIWRPLADHWPTGMTVTAPDWPGYGGRTPLATTDGLEALAEAMADHLPPDAIWVGWSLGGLLVAALVEHQPASLPPPRGLIQLGIGERFCHPEGVSTRELAAFRRAFARDPDATLAHFRRRQLSGEPDPRGAHRRLLELIGDDVDAATLAAGLGRLAGLDVSEALKDAPCPVRRLTGRHDPLLAEETLTTSDRVLEEAGHCPMLSRSAALAEALVALSRDMTASPKMSAEEARR